MKRIFFALALLPVLSLPAHAGEKARSVPAVSVDGRGRHDSAPVNKIASGVQLQNGIGTPCEKGMEFRFAFIKESKTFAVCDGENWRRLVVGDVIQAEKPDPTEGADK